jgi:DNA-binding SARP family transcriptional activator
MYIRVLGPMSLQHDEAEMTPTAQKPCTVLALLLLNHLRVVPISALMDELWQEAPPRTARTALQTYIFHLRKKLAEITGLGLAEVAGTILQTVPNGYRFVTEPGQFDLEVYHRLQRAGSEAMDAADFPSAAEHFREALRLWHGPAVANVEPGTRIRAEAAALEQSRMTMLDYYIELELRLGLHREILSELAVQTSRNPFYENLHAQYMLALYRSGYRIKALEAFHKLRHNLRDEFGLEPSLELKRFHQAVLTLDPALDDVTVVPLPRRSAENLPEIARAGSF